MVQRHDLTGHGVFGLCFAAFELIASPTAKTEIVKLGRTAPGLRSYMVNCHWLPCVYLFCMAVCTVLIVSFEQMLSQF